MQFFTRKQDILHFTIEPQIKIVEFSLKKELTLGILPLVFIYFNKKIIFLLKLTSFFKSSYQNRKNLTQL